ncbi:hypothetical protein BHM03_00014666 [Ensete ventricosum]|nr:hypothetical protein BHM03_00014666 [Ensete ventricosum]
MVYQASQDRAEEPPTVGGCYPNLLPQLLVLGQPLPTWLQRGTRGWSHMAKCTATDELEAKELRSTKASTDGGGMTIGPSGAPSPSRAKGSPIASSDGCVVVGGYEYESEEVTCGPSPVRDSSGLGPSSINGSTWGVVTPSDGVVGGSEW